MTLRSCLLGVAAALAVSTASYAQFAIGEGPVATKYADFCAACHGDRLQGGIGPSLVDETWLHGSSHQAVAGVISGGVEDTDMPAFGDVLSAEDIRSLVIYIREQTRLVAEAASPGKPDTAEQGQYKTNLQSFRVEEVLATEGVIWAVNFLPSGEMLYSRRDGALFVARDGQTQRITGTPDVWHSGQGGLHDAAPHPEYADNGWIYLSYAHIGGTKNGTDAGMTKVVRGRIRDGAWTDEETLFEAPEAALITTQRHFGSRFVFEDGYVYFSIGDRGRKEMAQDLSVPNGKIHRIHDDGRVPADNPFVGQDGVNETIWSYGHRNPQGLAKDPVTGALVDTEHGPRGGDEVNIVEKGRNYGWPVITYGMNYNGTPMTDKTAAPGMEQPVTYYVPSIAIAGADFYDQDAFPEWRNDLFVGGMASEELHRLRLRDGRVTDDEIILKGLGRVRDVETGPDGSLYLALNDRKTNSGRIVRLVPVR